MGKMTNVYIKRKNRRHTTLRFGFIRYESPKVVKKEIRRLHGSLLKGGNIVVKWAKYAKESSVVSDSIKVTNRM
jgi:RNA recognition motif-containing protein